MKTKWICIVCLILCTLTGCENAEDDMYGGMPPEIGLDGTVVETDEEERQILVKITGPDYMVSPETCYGFETGELVLVKYNETGDFGEEAPKEGMYVQFTFSRPEETKEELGRKDGHIYVEAYSLKKNISFVNEKWSEGTYD